MSNSPKITNVIEAHGEISDELDYMVNMKLVEQRGAGLTACQPSLVELEGGQQAIKMGIDYTFVDSSAGQVMGYGIIGEILLSADPDNFEILYITSKEELDEKIKYILESDIQPSSRPRGKY